jgi:hypothetical protein
VTKWRAGLLPEMLWMCHLASLVLALGLVLPWARASALGFLFSASVAAPAYVLHLLSAGNTTWASFLLHLLAPLVGWWAWRRQTLPPATACLGFAGYLVVAVLCFLLTPEVLNINLVFKPWAPFSGAPLWLHRAVDAVLMLALLTAAQGLFNRNKRLP